MSKIGVGSFLTLVGIGVAFVLVFARADAQYPGFNGRIGFLANGDITTSDENGGAVQPLTTSGDLSSGPVWSPDGEQIVVASDHDEVLNRDIYLLSDDGQTYTRLTDEPSEERNPRWSPDGGTISFESNRVGGFFEIYRMDTDGGNVEPITDEGIVWQGFNHHQWSPDGTKIAATAAFEIVVMNADGSDIQLLTNAPNADAEPDWSPDGTKIVFHSSRDNNQELYVMNADGSGQANITNAPDSSETSGRWSPDGESILFRSDRNSLGDELYVMDANGGNIRKVSNASFDVADPQWQSLGSPSSSTPVPTPAGPTAPPAANVDCDGDYDLQDAYFMIAFLGRIALNNLCPAPGSEIDDHIQGDADCDGEFDAVDPLAALRFILGNPLPGACEDA